MNLQSSRNVLGHLKYHLKVEKEHMNGVIAAEKDSFSVVLDKYDHIKNVKDMIEEGIIQMRYVETTNNTFNELKIRRRFVEDQISPINF